MLKRMLRNLRANQTSKGFVLGIVLAFGVAMAVEAPPQRYVPTQTNATVFFAPPLEVQKTCSVGHPFTAIACARQTGTNRGIVIMPHPCDPGFKDDEYALLLCHELAHLKGWRHPSD